MDKVQSTQNLVGFWSEIFGLMERGMIDAGLIECSCGECPDDYFPYCYDVDNMDEILDDYYEETGINSYTLLAKRLIYEMDVLGYNFDLYKNVTKRVA